MDLKESHILGDAANDHWYYISKSNALIQSLNSIRFETLFDVGAGDGFFSKNLLNAFPGIKEAWCIDTSYSENSNLIVNGKNINVCREPPAYKPDLYIFMDVLEHVDDDSRFLESYVKAARKGAYFFFTVPAFPFLWSNHDVFLGHARRYTLKSFEELIKKSNLSIIRCNFLYGTVFPIGALIKILMKYFSPTPKSHLKRHTKFVNKLLLYLMRPEMFLSRYNRLFGLSISCLAKK